MKMFLISDNVDTLTGMRLAGIEGKVARTREEFELTIDSVIKDTSIGLVIITEKLSFEYSDIINDIKTNYKLPIIIDIPDRYGSRKNDNFISQYVNEAIGL